VRRRNRETDVRGAIAALTAVGNFQEPVTRTAMRAAITRRIRRLRPPVKKLR
jgi:hypothetical protein